MAVLDPGKLGIQEQVTIAAVSDGWLRFTPSFAHEAGALLAFGPFPFWASVHKHALIVVPEGSAGHTGAADPNIRRLVDDVMSRVATGVSTWDIVNRGSSGNVAQFLVGNSFGAIGTGTIGLTAYQSEL
jgi:hypothetical protein